MLLTGDISNALRLQSSISPEIFEKKIDFIDPVTDIIRRFYCCLNHIYLCLAKLGEILLYHQAKRIEAKNTLHLLMIIVF